MILSLFLYMLTRVFDLRNRSYDYNREYKPKISVAIVPCLSVYVDGTRALRAKAVSGIERALLK
ncbi:uncharacterized protein RSE6_15025 [Rhynchosporium secalis]|uniref:Uncharacterized protein n=1 Tax=Rhynchosporium secalis TaxID=38038 RepID=A0A1E1MWK8_RHYSE|nr:uncharacterized protein RSE6_15025 [Rhynchosporium secalis]